MALASGLELPTAVIAEPCRRHQVCELAVFGSAARGDARPGSDIDLLVEFQPQARVGLLGFARLMNELSERLGRKVDLVSKPGLKSLIRDSLLAEARVIYAAVAQASEGVKHPPAQACHRHECLFHLAPNALARAVE